MPVPVVLSFLLSNTYYRFFLVCFFGLGIRDTYTYLAYVGTYYLPKVPTLPFMHCKHSGLCSKLARAECNGKNLDLSQAYPRHHLDMPRDTCILMIFCNQPPAFVLSKSWQAFTNPVSRLKIKRVLRSTHARLRNSVTYSQHFSR